MEIEEYIIADDRTLVERSLAGDDMAFEYLFNRYGEAMRRLFLQRSTSAEDTEDLLQETYLACGRRAAYLQAEPEVPMYVKLRRIALQTLTDMERHHLAAAKRDAMKEQNPEDDVAVADAWAHFADTISSPRTHLERLERQAMARRVLASLSPLDREILELRHFEELGNAECAAVLGIEQKAASIRYVRALKRFRELVNNENPYA